MNRKITRRALAGKCGGRARSGLACASERDWSARRAAIARLPKPAPLARSIWRRVKTGVNEWQEQLTGNLAHSTYTNSLAARTLRQSACQAVARAGSAAWELAAWA